MSPEVDGDRLAIIPPEQQPDITFQQLLPVMNTWYTILDTTMARIMAFVFRVTAVGETLQLRITIDGQVYIGTRAAAAGTGYWAIVDVVAFIAAVYTSGAILVHRSMVAEGRAVKLEMRKTTAAGAGNLEAVVVWQRWP